MFRAGTLLLLTAAAACTAYTPPPASERAQALAARLPEESRARIGASTVPVLLPRSLGLARASLLVDRTWTALHVPEAGITVSLHAARIAHTYPGIAPSPGERRLRGGVGHVTRNENIWTAAWIEKGVAYALDVECAQAGDARCADDGYLVDLVDTLEEVGP